MSCNHSSRSLLQFLKQARHAHFQFISGALPRADSPIYVVGNPSVDLDSIISAIVYAYFAHNRLPLDYPRPHVPLINLSNVPSGPELRRLRPEFVKALWHCTNNPFPSEGEGWDDTPESAGKMLHDHIITVEDFAKHLQQSNEAQLRRDADATLVDWNALTIQSSDGQRGKGSLNDLPTVDFSVVGCIDHHVNEDFLPSAESLPAHQPLVVQPAGSCTSLVVNTLESLGLWQNNHTGDPLSQKDAGKPIQEAQVAKLALAAILIDTSNLTDKSKVTESDTNAVSFLQPKIDSFPFIECNQETYYNQVFTTKQNSLDLLTVHEILGRDFKCWTENLPQSKGGKPINIGFCSTVKSIPWIVQKADGNPQSFLDSLYAFSTDQELDIAVVMTAFTCPAGDNDGKDRFCRELLICAPHDGPVIEALESFVAHAASKLGLEDWVSLDIDLGTDCNQAVKSTLNNDAPAWKRVWVQTNVTQSRKQVAPLLRGAVSACE